MISNDAMPPPGAFTWPVRVYYEDTDAGGVVYHAAYLRFFERARTEWLRARGFHQGRLREESGVVFVVRAMSVDFLLPARFDDELAVNVHDVMVRRASFALKQAISHGDKVLCRATVRVACVDAGTFAPRPLPQSIRGSLDER